MTLKPTQELALSTDIHVITAEINAYKRIAGEAIFEIGRRLKLVRSAQSTSDDAGERTLAQQREQAGGWIRWLTEHVDFDRTHAHRFITVFSEMGDVGMYQQMGLRALYEITTLPSEERERPHTVPSTGAIKTVDEMTVRELREVKAALKAERERADRAETAVTVAEDEAALLRETLESVREQPPHIEYQTQTGTRPGPGAKRPPEALRGALSMICSRGAANDG
ncbi:hypothetical protein [Paenibacillus tyrfis]|uniref:hypothetical protein n=1 Tax=Paenibacillus tyrfis TaxID=1501230 RepID=UPI0015C6143C|nr:hypothetical protein [Paenibacillus tyrfis]